MWYALFMPKPTDIAPAKLEEWERLWTERIARDPQTFCDERAHECYLAGSWLWERLLELGLEEKDAETQTLAMGQVCVGRPDSWEVAKTVLQDVHSGKRWLPGEKLASALLSGQLSDHFGPGGEGRNIPETLKTLGVSSMQELFDRLGVKNIAEAEAKVRAELARLESKGVPR